MKCKTFAQFSELFGKASDMIARLDYGGSMVDLSSLREHLDSIVQANPVFMRYYMGTPFEVCKDTGFRTTNDCPDYLRS